MKGAGSFFGWLGHGLLKVLKFLLFRLGLWVPAAYSLLFVIVAAVTRTAFSSVWGVYVFGLCVTCVFAVALACLGFIHRADKKKAGEGRSAGYVKEMTENQNNVQFVEGAQGDGNQASAPAAAPPQGQPYPGQPAPQQPYQAAPQQPYQGQPYPGQTYAQPYQAPQNGGYAQPYPQAAPYAQPYQPQQPQQPQQPAQTDYNRDYNRDYGRGFGGNASGGETTIDGKPGFFSYNVDREPKKPEYTGGDPGFLSYYPERDAENVRRTAAFDTGEEPTDDFARRDRDFTRDNDFSRSNRGDFGRADEFTRGDTTNRGDFGRSETRGFGGSTDGFTRGGRGEESAAAPFPTAVPEKPAIFRTRMDPNMLIYEYSDRLEFYKITAQGPVRVSVEYKNPCGNR